MQTSVQSSRKHNIAIVAICAAMAISMKCGSASAFADRAAWRSLPVGAPQGEKQSTGSFTVADRPSSRWEKPRFVFNAAASMGRKDAKVIVLIYDPALPKRMGRGLIEELKANDPVEYSRILANVIREASWGYLNYDIVDIIRVQKFPIKVDGFRYTEDTYFEARKTNNWQSATSSYRAFFTENGLLDRCKREGITELWVWGASGMHMDELAMFIPNRYGRFGPTDNPWLYRPYDIPEELGRTTWVMGFNYEVGPDNMIHSYVHRVESMAALALADGVWEPHQNRDPWNVFSWLEMEHLGTPSMVGNCHVPPNGQGGYDYNNKRRTLSWSDRWSHYPDLRGEPREISSQEWGTSQFGYMKWILERIPKFPGATRHGYNNWWVYIANTDEELPDYRMQDLDEFVLPKSFPPPTKPPKK